MISIKNGVNPTNYPRIHCLKLLNGSLKKSIIDFSKMTNISKENRDILKNVLIINPFQSVDKVKASDGSATKYIFQVKANVFIEAVAIQEKGYETLCISSQAGCPVDCKFCLTGVSGLQKKT